MRTALDILSAFPWCMDEKWLRFMAALANRDAFNARELAAELRKGPDDGWGSFDESQLRPESINSRRGKPLAGTQSVSVRDGVAIVPIVGPIFPRANLFTEISGATSMDLLAADIVTARESAVVQAILYDVDSPGGAAQGLDELALTIEETRNVKPTLAHASGLCASAAYWLACAAGEIVANRSAILGSVGVVVSVAVQEQPGQDGVMEYEIVSSNAENKRPDPREPEGEAVIRDLLDQVETLFVGEVARLRGLTPERVVEDFGRGGVAVGAQAVAAGMADGLGTFDTAMAALVRRLRPAA